MQINKERSRITDHITTYIYFAIFVLKVVCVCGVCCALLDYSLPIGLNASLRSLQDTLIHIGVSGLFEKLLP